MRAEPRDERESTRRVSVNGSLGSASVLLGEETAGRRLAYRPAELAAMVGLSVKAVYRAIERGELGAAKVANGSRLLIPTEAAEAWLVPQAAARRASARTPRPRRVRPSGGRTLGEVLRNLECRENED